MAIKGYLSDINFVELLKVVGNYNGKLLVWNFTENKQYECFFCDKSVIYMNFCGKVVSAKDAVKNVILELNTDKKSYYAFQDDAFAAKLNNPIISISELISSSLSDNSETNDEVLPNIHTRFETVSKNDIEIQGELSDFWKNTARLLHKGSSAGEICAELGMDEKTVRQNLYKLRTTGMIKPVRMFNAVGSMAKSRAMNQKLSRLAGSLNSGGQLSKLAQLNPSAQKNVSMTQKPQTVSEGAVWQNAYENLNYPDNRQIPPAQTTTRQEAALNFKTEDIPLPEFLSVPEQFPDLVMPEPMPKTPVSTQFENAVFPNPANFQNPHTETNSVQTYSADVIQVSDNNAQATSNYPVHAAAAAQNESQWNVAKENQNAAPSTRTGLVKRMLSSLFKR